MAASMNIKKVWLSNCDSDAARVDLPKLHQLFGVWIWQRPQQHTINDAEDRSGGANTQGKRKNRNEREGGPFAETTNTNANVFD
jgi:hypothetical protein